MQNNTQGFTLIELLIVIAIIGILAAVLIPNLLGAQKRAYDTAALGCANGLAKAVAIYRVDNPSTSNTPAVGDLYGDATKDETYGASACTKLPTGSTITGAASATGAYSYVVKHAQGKNTYTISQSGISNS